MAPTWKVRHLNKLIMSWYGCVWRCADAVNPQLRVLAAFPPELMASLGVNYSSPTLWFEWRVFSDRENHGNSMGKLWFNGIWYGFTLWLCHTSHWKWPSRNLMSFPIRNGGSFQSVMETFTRGWTFEASNPCLAPELRRNCWMFIWSLDEGLLHMSMQGTFDHVLFGGHDLGQNQIFLKVEHDKNDTSCFWLLSDTTDRHDFAPIFCGVFCSNWQKLVSMLFHNCLELLCFCFQVSCYLEPSWFLKGSGSPTVCPYSCGVLFPLVQCIILWIS